MSETFSKIHIQIVFAVKGRASLIHQKWDEELYMYIAGIINAKGQKMMAINGVADHIHIFIGMRPSCNLPDLVREIKKSSTTFINAKKLTEGPFRWQNG